MSDNWLVIGGTGLIGTELCCELRARGNVVHSLSRRTSFNSDHIIADVTQTDWLKLISRNFYDHVVYCAYSSSSSLSESKKVNVDGPLDLAIHLNGSKLRSFGYLGSMTVFGQVPTHDVVSELSPKISIGTYASAKAFASEQLMAQNFTFRMNILHPTNVYSRQSENIKNWTKILEVNRIHPGKNTLGVRNLVHTSDVVNAIIEVSRRVIGRTNEEFIVNGEIVTWKDFLELLSARSTSKRVLPSFVANLTKGPIRKMLNNFGFITPLKLPKYKLKIIACNATFESRKLEQMTGWAAKKKFKFEMRQEK